jgi:hypothetical protein
VVEDVLIGGNLRILVGIDDLELVQVALVAVVGDVILVDLYGPLGNLVAGTQHDVVLILALLQHQQASEQVGLSLEFVALAQGRQVRIAKVTQQNGSEQIQHEEIA